MGRVILLVRYGVALVGAAIVFLGVYLIVGFFTLRMFEGVPTLDWLIGVGLPLVLGLVGAIDTFRTSLRFRRR